MSVLQKDLKLPTGLRAAQWVRVSTEEQSKEGHAGVQRQIEHTQRIVASRGYQLVASYVVTNVSGASVVEHAPEFQQLLARVQAGEIQVVVVSEVSRLMRVDSWESMRVLDVFAKHKCLIVGDGFQIDFSNPEGFLMGGLHTLIAGHERMMMMRKINDSKEALRRQGKLPSAPHTLPRGLCYDRKTQKFYYDPNAIQAVQQAFALVDSGLHNMAEVSRRTGIKRTALSGILRNEAYLGFRVYDKKRDPTIKLIGPKGRQGSRPKIARSSHEIIRVKIIDEPAVSPECFSRVGKVLAEFRTNHAASLPKERRVHFATGIGRCGYCGSPLYITNNSSRNSKTGEPAAFYCCRSQHPGKKGSQPRCANAWASKTKLDSLMIAFCKTTLSDPEVLTSLISGSISRNSEVIVPFPERDNVSAIQKLERKEKRLLEMCQAEALTIAEFKSERSKLRAEIETLKKNANQNHLLATKQMTIPEFSRLIVKAAAKFGSLGDHREQKMILEQIFSEVFFRCKRRAEATIIAFRLNPAFVALIHSPNNTIEEVVNLEQPFKIDSEIPEGSRRCKICFNIKTLVNFTSGSYRCKDCLATASRERRRKWKLN